MDSRLSLAFSVFSSTPLVVLDENLFDMDRNAIYKIKPVAVMMEGQWIHGELGEPN